MSFSRRELAKHEISGLKEISPKLRFRINTLIFKQFQGFDNGAWDAFQHAVNMDFGRSTYISTTIKHVPYNEVLDLVEVFLEFFGGSDEVQLYEGFCEAFEKSGSVYFLDEHRQFKARLSPDELTQIDNASVALGTEGEFFLKAISDLLARKKLPRETVNDINIAFEAYLKRITNTLSAEKAITQLDRLGVKPSQKSIIGMLRGYRSNSDKVAHSALGSEPDLHDAIWYAETVAAQVVHLDRVYQASNARERSTPH